MSTWLARLGRLAGRLTFVGVWLWLVGAAWYSGLGPAPVPEVLAFGVFAGFPVAWYRTQNRRRVAGAFAGFAFVAITAWQLKRPATDRDWTADMRTASTIVIEGDRVTIRGMRAAHYRSPEDYDVRSYDRTFDLATLRSIDFLVERFHAFEGLAHTLLSFGFEGGEHVCISVEVRREEGESFNPVAGLFREYELLYVVGSEQDLIGLRTNHRGSTVWLYPVKTTPARRRALFLDMLRRARQLAEEPEFYNTLLSSCTTNIVDHVCSLVPGRVPFDWRILLPGYSGELAYELGLIETDLSFADTQARFRIDDVAQEAPVGADFSRRIRSRR